LFISGVVKWLGACRLVQIVQLCWACWASSTLDSGDIKKTEQELFYSFVLVFCTGM